LRPGRPAIASRPSLARRARRARCTVDTIAAVESALALRPRRPGRTVRALLARFATRARCAVDAVAELVKPRAGTCHHIVAELDDRGAELGDDGARLGLDQRALALPALPFLGQDRPEYFPPRVS